MWVLHQLTQVYAVYAVNNVSVWNETIIKCRDRRNLFIHVGWIHMQPCMALIDFPTSQPQHSTPQTLHCLCCGSGLAKPGRARSSYRPSHDTSDTSCDEYVYNYCCLSHASAYANSKQSLVLKDFRGWWWSPHSCFHTANTPSHCIGILASVIFVSATK